MIRHRKRTKRDTDLIPTIGKGGGSRTGQRVL